MTVTDRETRSRPPRRRQQEVVDAAARVFHERGYESTSIQDIADNLGILKGSLYYYIRSKEDLLNEILWGVHDDALANIQRVEEVKGDALQKVRAFITLHITFNIENLVKMGVFFHDFRSLSKERRQRIIEARDLYDKILRDLIADGQREGLVCPDVDPKMASMAALGMCNWIYQWYRPRGRLRPDEVAGQFADLVIAGLACDRKTHRPGHRSKLGALMPELQPRPIRRRRSRSA